MPPPPSFRPGGPLDLGDVYIVRPADAELFDLLSRGDYAYVVGPTQLGKTNLALRAIERLRREGHPSAPKGFRCALVDLSDVGFTEDAHAWFRGLVRIVRENLGLPESPVTDDRTFTPAETWRHFLSRELPQECDQRVVIVFDEIHVLLWVPAVIRTDFLGVIRAAQVDRGAAKTPVFGFLGMAYPDELCDPTNRTVFNAATPVTLDDFTEAQARSSFLKAFRGIPGAEQSFARTYWWTSGHPYMMQRICEQVLKRWTGTTPTTMVRSPEELVDHLVTTTFLRRGRFNEEVLLQVESRLQDLPESARVLALTLYRDLLQDKPHAARIDSPAQRALRLCGLVSIDDSRSPMRLCVRSRVFSRAFDEAWVSDRILALDRPFRVELAKWIEKAKHPDFTLVGKHLGEAKVAFQALQATSEEQEFLSASEKREYENLAEKERHEAEKERHAAEEEKHRADIEAANARHRLAEEKLLRTRAQRTAAILAAILLAVGGVVGVQYFRTQKLESEKTQLLATVESARLSAATDDMKKAVDDYNAAKKKIDDLLAGIASGQVDCKNSVAEIRGNIATLDRTFGTLNDRATEMDEKTKALQSLVDKMKEEGPTLSDTQARLAEAEKANRALQDRLALARREAAECEKKLATAPTATVTSTAAASCDEELADLKKSYQDKLHKRLCEVQKQWDSARPPKPEPNCP